MLGWFEKLLHPYQEEVPPTPPRGFIAFIWACTKGARRYILAMTVVTAATGAFEALLFAMICLPTPSILLIKGLLAKAPGARICESAYSELPRCLNNE